MKILLLQVVTPEIADYAQFTVLINAAYAKHRGYDYEIYNDVEPARHPSWSKIKAVRERLESYDRVFVVDADAYIQNFEIKVEDFTGKPLKFCKNGDNGGDLLNAGLFMVDDAPGIHRLLERWWLNHFGDERFWEQCALNRLYQNSNGDEFKKAIDVYPMRAFNSWWRDAVQKFNADQFVIHVMGRSNSHKAQLLEAAYEEMKVRYPLLDLHVQLLSQ